MRRFILIFLISSTMAWGGNLNEIINLAQSATRENLTKFNKLPEFKDEKSRLNFSFDGRYTFVPSSSGGYMTKSGGVTAKIEYLLFDGGASEAANKILLHQAAEQLLQNEELRNLTSLQIGRIYFNAVAIDALIELENELLKAVGELINEADFWVEFGEINADEFATLNAMKARFAAQLEDLNLKRAELVARVNLLSNGELNFIAGSRVARPDFSARTSTRLDAKEQEAIAKAHANAEQSSKIMPKIYLKDQQGFDNESFKMSKQSGGDMAGRYAAANKPTVELKWNIPDELVTSRAKQQKRIDEQRAALSLSDARTIGAQKLAALKERIESTEARVRVGALRQARWKEELNNYVARYARGELAGGELVFLLERAFDERLNFILDGDELEILKMEYFFERGDEITRQILH